MPGDAVDVRPLVRMVVVGHVDHGKSTLLGRLLHETGSLADGKLDQPGGGLRTKRGMLASRWSFVLDALQSMDEHHDSDQPDPLPCTPTAISP